MRRYAARRDSNEREIVDALRRAGCTVDFLSGAYIPDLLVGYAGLNFLVEVKTATGDLRPGQRDWHQRWAGMTLVVRSPKEAIDEVNGCLLDLGSPAQPLEYTKPSATPVATAEAPRRRRRSSRSRPESLVVRLGTRSRRWRLSA